MAGALSIVRPFVRPDVAPGPLFSANLTGPSGNPWRIATVGTGGIFPGGFGFNLTVFPTELETTLEVDDMSFVIDYELERDWGYIYIEAWEETFTSDPYYLETDHSTADDPHGTLASNGFGAFVGDITGITGRSNGFVTVTVDPASIAAAEVALGGPVAYFDLFVVEGASGASWQCVEFDSFTINGVTDDFDSGTVTLVGYTGTEGLVNFDESDIIGLNDFVVSESGQPIAGPPAEFVVDEPFRYRWAVNAAGFGSTTGNTGSTSVSAAAPSDLANGDLEFIFVESSDSSTAAGTPNTPSGWTKIFERTQADGATGVTTLTIFARLNTGTIGSVTVDGVTDHLAVRRTCYGAHQVSDVTTDIDVGTGDGADTGNPVALSLTTTEDNSIILFVASTTRDAISSTTFSSVNNGTIGNSSGGNVGLWFEKADITTSTGAGGGLGVYETYLRTAGSTGASTMVAAVSDKWNAVHLAFPAETSHTWKVQYRDPPQSGTWTDIDGSTPIKTAASVAYDDGDPTLNFNQAARYLTGEAEESGNSIPFVHIAARQSEFEFCLEFDGGQVSAGDTFGLRLTNGTDVSAEVFVRVAAGVGDREYDGWYWGRFPGFDVDFTMVERNYGVSGTWDGKLWFNIITAMGIDPGVDFYTFIASYDPEEDVWAEHGTRQLNLSYGQSAVYDGKLYFFNAFDENFDPLPAVQIYDIDTDTWTTGASCPAIADANPGELRQDGVAIAHNGKVYILGGVISATPSRGVGEVHIYDIAGDSFTTGESYETGTTYDELEFDLEFVTAAILNGVIYLAGPKYSDVDPISTVAAYDITGDSWEEIPTTDPPFVDDTYHWETAGIMANPADDTLWVVPTDQWDADTPLNPITHTMIYDPGSATWSEGPEFPNYMSLGQWVEDVREGFNNFFWSDISRPVFDSQTFRGYGTQTTFSGRVATGTTDTRMVMVDWSDTPRSYAFEAEDDEEPYWD